MLLVMLMIAIFPVLLHFAQQSFSLFKKRQNKDIHFFYNEKNNRSLALYTICNHLTFPAVTKVQRILDK